MGDIKDIVKESFITYAGAVLQSRAIVDVRDCLKPSARQIYYALYTDKFISSKPYRKTLKAVGSLARFYIHGDASAVGVLMRSGQDFSLRYPLMDVKGNFGSLMESGNWASQRYTESRLSKIADLLFEDIQKDTISEWRDNYDNTEQYPGVLPTKGFYNIVNGTLGIGVGAASSIPAYNLREVNEALIKLLWNPEIDFDEIFCAPDFATGGILLNRDEVKESMKNGQGKSCKLRSVIEYDNKEKVLVVTQLPYGVYTNTICEELNKILESDENPGIDRYIDSTGSKPLIKIYLTKTANINKVLKYLYTNTSLQSYYGINFTLLDHGRFPRIFTWREALLAHLDHEKEVYRRGYEYDVRKIRARLHIIQGLLAAIDNIDEVVQTIKTSSSTKDANIKLQKLLEVDEEQAKAILEIKLSRLAKLETSKLTDEWNELEAKLNGIMEILQDETKFKAEIEKGFRKVIEKYGDERRTQVLNIEGEDDAPVEVKSLIINLTNKNNLMISEASSLYISKRGAAGTKMKVDKDEYIVSTTNGKTTDTLLFFTNRGNMYSYDIKTLETDTKIAIEQLVPIQNQEQVCSLTNQSNEEKQFALFFTKEGYIKKTSIEDFSSRKKQGLKVITLGEKDEIVSVLFCNEDNFGIITSKGQFLISTSKDIKPVGRVAKGIKGIKLEDDYVIGARLVPKETKDYIFLSSNGLIKKVRASEFSLGGHNTKGTKVIRAAQKDNLKDFLPINDERYLITQAKTSQIKIDISSITRVSKTAAGAQVIKLKDSNSIIGIVTI